MGVTLRRNSLPVKSNPFYHYNPRSGYFGTYVSGNKIKTRLIYAEDPEKEARELFRQFVVGAKIDESVPGKKWSAVLEDCSVITLRIRHPTPEHEPAVMISVKKSDDPAGIRTQKIHFVKKGEDKK